MATEGSYRVKPMPDRVLVELVGLADRTSGGLWLPATSTPDRPTTGIIADIFEPYEEDGNTYKCRFQIGDKVLFGKYTGSKFTIGRGPNARDYLLLREQDIMATLHDIEFNEVETHYG